MPLYNIYRLLYEYGEILIQVSIAVTRALFIILIIRLDHSNIMDDIPNIEFAAVISS